MADVPADKFYTFEVDAVDRAIRSLSIKRSHEHFPGYLAVLQKRTSDTSVRSSDIVDFHIKYLRVDDAPEERPYLRPFRSRGEKYPPELYQRNVAGSYARSSIREGRALAKVLKIDQDTSKRTTYSLPDEHWSVVLAEMLSGTRQPVVAMAAFLLRDRAFPIGGLPTIDGAIKAFRRELRISSADPDGDVVFNTLFADDRSVFTDDDLVEVPNEKIPEEERELGSPSFKFRSLTLADLQLGFLTGQTDGSEDVPTPPKGLLDEDDPILADVRAALDMGYAGVLLSGPPGTGKSWYAQQIGVALTGSEDTVRSVQFHPSYQYEDFVFGYVARRDGAGFELVEKEFAIVCRAAARNPDSDYVLVVDEISRSDVIRVFGEALTYLETDKRNQAFKTASGEELTVPSNLVLIGTMNPWDRGVDELDVALERRFAHVALDPNPAALRRLLIENDADEAFADRIIGFFEKLQAEDTEGVRIGHAYFLKCTDPAAAERVWRFRLEPTLKRACRLNDALFKQLERDWKAVVTPLTANEEGGMDANPADPDPTE